MTWIDYVAWNETKPFAKSGKWLLPAMRACLFQVDGKAAQT
jgi:hypothetical protein